MLNFQKSLAYQMIENTYLEQEERQQHHKIHTNTRSWSWVGVASSIQKIFEQMYV